MQLLNGKKGILGASVLLYMVSHRQTRQLYYILMKTLCLHVTCTAAVIYVVGRYDDFPVPFMIIRACDLRGVHVFFDLLRDD